MNKFSPSFEYHNTFDPVKLPNNSNKTEKWKEQKMSNFDYLMFLNSISSRSLNDLAQYPVFPWVVLNFQSSTL